MAEVDQIRKPLDLLMLAVEADSGLTPIITVKTLTSAIIDEVIRMAASMIDGSRIGAVVITINIIIVMNARNTTMLCIIMWNNATLTVKMWRVDEFLSAIWHLKHSGSI